MTGEEATLAVIDALESLGVAYMLVGSFASNFYGIPRATQDADFVVQLDRCSVSKLAGRLGSGFRLNPQMSFELVTGTTRFLIEAGGAAFQIELFLLSEDPHDQDRFQRRRRVPMLGRIAFVAAAEDVIITKLRWSKEGRRPKDLLDVRNVLAVQETRIDWDYVITWCERHGTRKLLDEIRQSTLLG